MNAVLTPFKRKYLMVRSVETLVAGTGIFGFVFAIMRYLVFSSTIPISVSLLAGTTFVMWRVFSLKLFHLTENHLASWLNQQYPAFQQSIDLLLKPSSSLTTLQQIQQVHVSEQLLQNKQHIAFPHRLPMAFGMLLTGAAAWLFLTGKEATIQSSSTSQVQTPHAVQPTASPTLTHGEVTVTPPSYTGIKTKVSSQLKLKVPEQSRIIWRIQFSHPVRKAWILFSDKDSLTLVPDGGYYSTSMTARDQGFYTIHWADSSRAYQSDFLPFEIVPDEAPVILTEGLPAYTEVTVGEKVVIPVKARISDDYGVNDAFIVATVAKGSGESVKFREEIMRFTAPPKFGGSLHHALRNIDIAKLGLEPGDELYFYVEANDRRIPVPNESRTETFFIAVRDTATVTAIADEGLGVDLMPEYFRSQRQIIIDSEKLLKEKSSIAKSEFNSRSNELGYDQKVLRLRYGQFMGEEFESGLVASTPEGEQEEDPLKQFGHQHDTKNEHNLVAEKGKQAGKDDHDHEKKTNGDENEKANPLDEFIHQHDNTEEATFFVQSVKAKLRAALNLMWDAELHLRLYAPQTSLPYQYKILKLLKEISNDSRIYVHRTGFDPPPLKEEKRLAGDLSEIRNSTTTTPAQLPATLPAIRSLLTSMDQLIQSNDSTWNSATMKQFRAAGQELAKVAMEQPNYIKDLSLLKGLLDESWGLEQRRRALIELRSTFWQVLPSTVASPGRREHTRHSLEDNFLKNLDARP